VAIVKTMLFLEDQLHSSVDGAEIEAASNTHKGNMHNVRDANYLTFWKPLDDLVTNAAVRADFQDGTVIAQADETFYAAVAYDPRNTDQTTIIVQYDATDNPSFVGATSYGIFTVNSAHLPTCQWMPLVMPNPAKRYWRLMQRVTDRSGAGRTIPIFYWAMMGPAHVVDLDTEGNKPGPGAGAHGFVGSAGISEGPAASAIANDVGYSRQRFDVTVRPANTTLFEKIRDGLKTGDLMNRAIFVQFEGLRNDAEPNFQLCRVDTPRLETARGLIEKYEITIPLITEAFV
jgi:hypothetical protein